MCIHACMLKDMPRDERKREYAHVSRLMKKPGVDPAVLERYRALSTDADRPVGVLNPHVLACMYFLTGLTSCGSAS